MCHFVIVMASIKKDVVSAINIGTIAKTFRKKMSIDTG